MAEALLLACHLALALALLAASLSHLLAAAVAHLAPSPSPSALHHHRLLRALRSPLIRLLPALLALPFAFLPLAGAAASTPLLPLLLLPPLLPLFPLPFLPPHHLHHLPLLRALLLSLPLFLLARAADLLAASFPASDLQGHALAVARLLLLAAAVASLASSLLSASAQPRGTTTAAGVHFAAEAALACAGAVGGLWAAQSGLTLYVDACVPAGCHRLLDAGAPPATRCDVDEARLRAVAVMDLALSVHCVVVAAVASGVLLGVARCLGVDGSNAGTGRRHNGSSYDALPTVASAGAMAEMEHLQGKGVVGKSVAQE